jgi:WD40 repeat protein
MAERCLALLLALLCLTLPVTAAPLSDPSLGYSNTLLVGHTDTVWDVAFSPDGKLLASASDDHTVRLWDTATGKEVANFGRQPDEMQCVAFSPDGKLLAAGDDAGTIYFWETATRKLWAERSQTRAKPSRADGVTALAFAPDGKTLASASRDGTVWLWRAQKFRRRMALNGHKGKVLCLAFSPDGKTLASGGRDGRV